MEPRLLKPAEAAKYLGIGERTLRALAARGEINRKKIGRLTRYEREELDAYADTLPDA